MGVIMMMHASLFTSTLTLTAVHHADKCAVRCNMCFLQECQESRAVSQAWKHFII